MSDPSTAAGGCGPERDFCRPFRLTTGDLIGDLLWPRLFRVPRLALRPGRIALAALVILLIGLIDQTLAAATGADDQPVIVMLGERLGMGLAEAGERAAQLEIGHAVMAAWGSVWYAITQTFADAPWRASFVLPTALLIYITLAVGIARMAVEDFARGRAVGWTEALRWSLQGFFATLTAHLVPIVVILMLTAILALGGYALLGVPFVNIVGAVLSVLGVVIGFVSVIMIVGLFLGGPMLAPAIAAEGFDGIEAMQRIYSYIFTRPARFAAYTIVLAAQFVVVSSIAVALAYATVAMTSWGMGLIFDWTGNTNGLLVVAGQAEEGMTWGGRRAAGIVGMALKLPGLVAAGFLLCYWISGWSVQYLLLRQAADGQDVTDIYVPGEIEARVDRALAARAAMIEVDQPSAGESAEASPESDESDGSDGG